MTVRRIILIESNDLVRGALRGLLEGSGHAVTDFRSGVEGLAGIVADRPSAAIVGIGLDERGGYEMARRVRLALGRTIFLIAVSGHGQEADRVMALSAGFDAHLIKPVSIELVERVLDGIPDRRRQAVERPRLITRKSTSSTTAPMNATKIVPPRPLNGT